MNLEQELQNKKTPRDFFLYLFSTAGVYYIAISIIALLWRYVDYFYPDKIFGGNFDLSSGLRFSVASLIVVFPAYIAAMHFLSKDIDRNPEKQGLKIRKWLIYLTLFISSLTIIGDLIATIYNFLGGDLATRFILKALSVLLVSTAIFGYYYFILKRTPGTQENISKKISWASSVSVAIIVVGAFFLIGSPKTNRLINLDQKRVDDLQSIQWQIVNYWQQKGILPEELDKLNDAISGFSTPTDPETKEKYEYIINANGSFLLCANFSIENENPSYLSQKHAVPINSRSFDEMNNWRHKKGRECFLRSIDPELYPVREKLKN